VVECVGVSIIVAQNDASRSLTSRVRDESAVPVSCHERYGIGRAPSEDELC